jgi:hypoxanthine phosphoribosyltransferase
MERDIERVLISSEQIARRVGELAGEIAATYADASPEDRSPGDEPSADLTIVTILSGSMIFVADLIRQLPMRMKLGLVTVSSYDGRSTRPGQPRVLADINVDVAGRHVLIVDDILDTGGTLRVVRERLAAGGPKSIRACVLLRKPAKAPPDVPADFVGFDVEDVVVVGYGLDYDDLYRNYPHFGVLRRELYGS